MQPVEVANNALLQMAHQVNFFCKVKIKKKKKVKIKGEHSSSGEKNTTICTNLCSFLQLHMTYISANVQWLVATVGGIPVAPPLGI